MMASMATMIDVYESKAQIGFGSRPGEKKVVFTAGEDEDEVCGISITPGGMDDD